MKMVIATDSFKGSISAKYAAAAMACGAARAYPDAIIVELPLGDGGEGTVDALVAAIPKSRTIACEAINALGARIIASYGLLGESGETAVVEMAAASGITLVKKEELDPLHATTFGTGELIQHALSRGSIRELIIGIGGSATNDCGVGALQALGVEFIDEDGERLAAPMRAIDIARVTKIAAPRREHADVKITVACDVTNPLTGPRGASHVFGPQKGATPEIAQQLDRLLTDFAPLLDQLYTLRGGGANTAVSIADRPGSGAAGGLGAALMALFPNAEFRPGIDVVLDAVGFDRLIHGADFVLTGEGKLDSQTLGGKAIDGVLRRSRAANVPVIAFAGSVDPNAAAALRPLGLVSAHGILPFAKSLEDAMTRGPELLEGLVFEVLSKQRQSRKWTCLDTAEGSTV